MASATTPSKASPSRATKRSSINTTLEDEGNQILPDVMDGCVRIRLDTGIPPELASLILPGGLLFFTTLVSQIAIQLCKSSKFLTMMFVLIFSHVDII